MSPTINTPVEGFTGTVAGVNFINGVGETDNPRALAYFERQGYRIDETENPTDTGDKKLSPKEQLQATATKYGLSTEGTKADLEARIKEHETAQQSTSAENPGDGGDE